MATETEKLKLVKPAGGDYVDVGVLNENFNKIDDALTDDIAGNSTSSTKYPSTKAVWDTFLPRTGGTLSGRMYTGNGTYNGYGSIASNENETHLTVSDEPDALVNPRYLKIKSKKTENDVASAFFFTDFSTGKDYAVFGEHNKDANFIPFFPKLKIKSGTDRNLNLLNEQGQYILNFRAGESQNGYNTPYGDSYSNVTDYLVFVISSRGDASGAGDRCVQYVYAPFRGQQKTWIRYKHDTIWSDWQELGGGGMRVPIAFSKGSLGYNQTLNLNGKGTIWISANGNSSQGFSATIDGGTPFSYAGYVSLPSSSTSGNDPVPIDFEKSISITNNGQSYSFYYAYQLYK